MRTFIFAIGGSGARVMRSLTMLLASGCKNTSVDTEFVPILIDYDRENHDTDLAKLLMMSYREIHDGAYNPADRNIENHFFCTPLKQISDICTPIQRNQIQSDFALYMNPAEANITFSEYIHYNNLSVANSTYETRQLLESLYNDGPEKTPGTLEDNPSAELHMNLHKGFKGCPNLGCIVTKQLQIKPELVMLRDTLITPNDRIVIVGSVFGGTGASGIPMLVDFFNQSPTTQHVHKTVVAVLPYFSLTPPTPDSAIDSSGFIAKTKAAITAYGLNNGLNNNVDCLYYAGDQPQNAYNNCDGGRNQRNDAHYTELVASMCIMDSLSQVNRIGVELGFSDNVDNTVTFNSFTAQEKTDYLLPLCSFKLFSTFIKRMWKTAPPAKEVWYHGVNEKGCTAIGDKQCKDYRAEVSSFVNSFDSWIDELANDKPHRPLMLFNSSTTSYDDVFSFHRITRTNLLRHEVSLLDDGDFCHPMTDSYNKLCATANGGHNNRPQYLFWRGAKHTMDLIFKTLKEHNIF